MLGCLLQCSRLPSPSDLFLKDDCDPLSGSDTSERQFWLRTTALVERTVEQQEKEDDDGSGLAVDEKSESLD